MIKTEAVQNEDFCKLAKRLDATYQSVIDILIIKIGFFGVDHHY